MSSIVVASESQVSAKLAGESAILNLDSELYYALDPVGSRVWELLREPCSVASIRDELLNEYEVEAERCERDLIALLQDLESNGLVTVTDK